MDTNQSLIVRDRLEVMKQHYWGDGFDDWDYLHCHGKNRDAVFYSTLFMPEVILVEDSVILRHRADDNESVSRVLDCLHKEGATQQAVEASFNIVEVAHIFGADHEAMGEEIELLTRILRNAWNAWLHHLFPNRSFTVEYIPPEENGDEIAITFYQDRS